MKSKNRSRLVTAIILVAVASFMDHQYFYESLSAAVVNPLIRQVVHLLILGSIIPIGYRAFSLQDSKWLKNLWVALYSFITILIFALGSLQWQFHFLSTGFLDIVSNTRVIFTSPLPLILFHLFAEKIFEEYKLPLKQ